MKKKYLHSLCTFRRTFSFKKDSDGSLYPLCCKKMFVFLWLSFPCCFSRTSLINFLLIRYSWHEKPFRQNWMLKKYLKNSDRIDITHHPVHRAVCRIYWGDTPAQLMVLITTWTSQCGLIARNTLQFLQPSFSVNVCKCIFLFLMPKWN